MRVSPSRWLLVVALALVAALVIFTLRGLLAAWESAIFDRFVRLHPAAAPEEIVLVEIDSESIDRLGRWPWPRSLTAELVRRIASGQPKVLGLDIVFSEPSRRDERCDLTAEDEELAAALNAAGNVVLTFFLRDGPPPSSPVGGGPGGDLPPRLTGRSPAGGFRTVPRAEGLEANLPIFADAAVTQGFSRNASREGVLRSYPLLYAYLPPDQDYPYYFAAFAPRIAALARGWKLSLGTKGRFPELELGGRPVAADEAAQLWLSFRGPAATFPRVSAAAVLSGEVSPGLFRDRIVLVGGSDPGLFDLVQTPLGGWMPGVEVHANAVSNLLAGDPIRYGGLQDAASFVALLLLPILIALLVAAIQPHLRGSLAALGLLLAWVAVAFAAFAFFRWHLQVVSPMLAAGLALVATLIYQVRFEERTTRRLRKYVPAAVAREIVRNPQLGRLSGPRREITVLFADIRGFTSIAEEMASEAVSELLHRFHTALTGVVFGHGGTLDKYMGDGLMALYGAPVAHPDHAARACRTALAMLEEVAALNRDAWGGSKLLQHRELHIGVGLNTDFMSVGDMGSEQVFAYTAIGNGVNLGSRIEGLNKAYRTEILLSEATAQAAGEELWCREIDRVRVKGTQVPVAVYELLAAEPVPESARERAERFARALAAYRKRDFVTAEDAFARLAADFPDDGPAAVFAERCRHLKANPPPGSWDGVEILTEK